jgi:hypothetical protein
MSSVINSALDANVVPLGSRCLRRTTSECGPCYRGGPKRTCGVSVESVDIATRVKNHTHKRRCRGGWVTYRRERPSVRLLRITGAPSGVSTMASALCEGVPEGPASPSGIAGYVK